MDDLVRASQAKALLHAHTLYIALVDCSSLTLSSKHVMLQRIVGQDDGTNRQDDISCCTNHAKLRTALANAPRAARPPESIVIGIAAKLPQSGTAAFHPEAIDHLQMRVMGPGIVVIRLPPWQPPEVQLHRWTRTACIISLVHARRGSI